MRRPPVAAGGPASPPVSRGLPPWAALTVVTLAGVASAVQGTVNAELGERAGNATLGAVVNNLGGALLVGLGALALPSARTGLVALRRARLPWWAYLGGLGGAAIVLLSVYIVPVLGVAVFTIAQVAGGSLGGLAVDRAGLAPVGRLALTRARVAGALLGVTAVALAQLGQPVGDLALGLVLLAVAGGLAVALQSALNARVSAAGSAAAGMVVNFATATPVVLLVAGLAGALTGPAPTWPGDWYLYTGGLLGVVIVAALLVGVPAVGVLRTGLALVAGQLGGALLLDALLPGGPGLRLPVLAGALLTLLAALLAGRGTGRRSTRAAPPASDGPAVPAATAGSSTPK
ncbi:DMT family transporter [Micromonospora peucetia]|uniref:DMT family transporter n=1 Tax=Micromonospora peucetia TaxID=47871 RepID=A0ABZ1ED37_9ACTN|nr:DMT family transporter [Micromonospora peucetia]MCX4385352.1 DMT family transporter [Micromonospora peucetia]WSA32754.1 DMT family transporter [Micromonospora peucetia]